MLGGCYGQKQENIKSARVYITGGPGNEPYFLEVSTDGTLEAATGDSLPGEKDGSLEYEKYLAEGFKKKSKKLSAKEMQRINQLIIDVINSGDKSYTDFGDDAVCVYAVIDDKHYNCTYHDYEMSIGEELRALAHELVKISPIKAYY